MLRGVSRRQRIEQWERITEWPLMVAAVLFLVAHAVPILDPTGSALLLGLCRWASWITWLLLRNRSRRPDYARRAAILLPHSPLV